MAQALVSGPAVECLCVQEVIEAPLIELSVVVEVSLVGPRSSGAAPNGPAKVPPVWRGDKRLTRYVYSLPLKGGKWRY
ncbi:hypothetical protein CEXT_661141 [Caerostris extrusa]|uniref:Uncharacterized protein n=1 Tax=Caerostris extrusa TaxID=172846 RepID=A0AAV4NFA7_CAEEX|nr:hypothetical protein CEXT_661141 [Caerostris extrusa]